MRKLFFVLAVLLALPLLAGAAPVSSFEVPLANLNIVILVLATIFAGIIAFLVYLERKLARLEKRQKAE